VRRAETTRDTPCEWSERTSRHVFIFVRQRSFAERKSLGTTPKIEA